MSRRHPYENRYCNHCRMTTRHEVKEPEYGCLRCGSVKYPPRVLKPKVVRPMPLSA
ncbi:MAG: hypothetical protein L6R28_06565 [Planctomycetes bacterium]|nr:hypothetical protein [Planctomycetota bacterium]